MKKDTYTTTHWQKEGNDQWQQMTTINYGRSIGKTDFMETYVNGILQEPIRVLNKKHWPYQFKIDGKYNIAEIERWCYERFKSGNWRNYGRMIAFKKQSDATLFVLIWS